MFAFAVVALFLSQAGAEAPERFPFSPELQPVYERAFAAMRSDSPADALPDVQRLLAEAPENPRTHRLAGQVHMLRDQPTDAQRALERALELGIDGPRRADVLAMLGAIHLRRDERNKAQGRLDEALQQNPDDPLGRLYSAELALIRENFELAREHARRFTELAPEAHHGHTMLAASLLGAGEPAEALAEVKRARELGATSTVLDSIESQATTDWWLGLAWKVPLGMTLALGLGLLLVWLAGHALSSVQLEQLSTDRVHLLRAEQSAAERRVDRLYSAVLWFASLLFYVSVPLMVVLTLGMASGLIFVVFMLPVIPVKLLVIVGILGIGGLVAVLRGLFISPEEREEGRPLTEAEAPALFAALTEVADVAKSRKVDRVLLHAGNAIGVREAGGRMKVLMGRGERILHLGLGAMRGLSVSELKSILAHEYGHFSHGETRLTPIISRIQTQVLQTIHGIQQLGWAFLNPVWWYLRVYFFIYLRITAGHGRRRELLADRVSALAYGGDTFARALGQVIENGAAFERGLGVAAGLREAGRPTKDLYRTIEAAARGTPAALQELTREELFARPVDAYDSHPPPSERVTRVAGLPAQRPVEDAPALTLFADPVKLAEELGGEVLEHLDTALQMQGYPAAEPVAVTDEERDQLAEAISLHHGALALGERNHADAYPLLKEAVARLEHAAGEQDPFLVPALTELSKVHVQHQDPGAARLALQRAIGIVQALPGHEQQQVDALNEMLKQVPEQQAA